MIPTRLLWVNYTFWNVKLYCEKYISAAFISLRNLLFQGALFTLKAKYAKTFSLRIIFSQLFIWICWNSRKEGIDSACILKLFRTPCKMFSYWFRIDRLNIVLHKLWMLLSIVFKVFFNRHTHQATFWNLKSLLSDHGFMKRG